jgi:hypothetical protein
MSEQRGILSEGFRRVWHYQRVLWSIFFINLVFGHFGAGAATHKLDFLDHSLQSRRLTDIFDYGTYSALSSSPEVKLFEVSGVSVAFSLVFFVGMLFLTGGILEAYRSERRLTSREFFEACGSYFWRWVRLWLLMVIVLIPVFILGSAVSKQGTTPMGSALTEKMGFWILVGGFGVIGLLLMCIRLWFDMAQVRAVVEEETGMWRNAGAAFRITLGDFGTLFWMYFRISVVGWLVFAFGLWVWAKTPARQFNLAFLCLELVVLTGFGVRLWQRASEMAWYQSKFIVPLATAPVAPVPVVPTPEPLVTIAPPPLSQT